MSMPRFFAEWHEPHVLDLTWPFWSIKPREHMTMFWVRGYAHNSDDLVVAAIFEAPDVETVRHEIGCPTIEVGLRPDGWMPLDPSLRAPDTNPVPMRYWTHHTDDPNEEIYARDIAAEKEAEAMALPPPQLPPPVPAEHHYPVAITTRSLIGALARLWAGALMDRARGPVR